MWRSGALRKMEKILLGVSTECACKVCKSNVAEAEMREIMSLNDFETIVYVE